MGTVKDLSGMRFGRLTVISFAFSKKNAYWLCKCDCGKEKIANAGWLVWGNAKSCGCQKIEESISHGFKTKHNKSRTPLYHKWNTIKSRCENPNDAKYKYYGGKGIFMCQEWREDFLAFESWVNANGGFNGLTLDRIDSNGPYSPENCRIVGYDVQNNNRSSCNYIDLNGERKTVAQWAVVFGVSKPLAWSRYYLGKRGLDLFKPSQRPKRNAE